MTTGWILSVGSDAGLPLFLAKRMAGLAGTQISFAAIASVLRVRMGLGIVLGITVGTVIGAAGGMMALLSARQMLPAAIAMTAGSALVVGVAYAMRRTA